MTDLNVKDFGTFFRVGNDGRSPFPWQEKLVATIADRLQSSTHAGPYWPALVDLPTGSGKSSLVDIAIFLLAIEADQPPESRRLPRRIVFVVDRRVVVDQAHQHARELADLLRHSSDSIVQLVARRLESYSKNPEDHNGPVPLTTTVLRGGIVRDESWARRPDIPAIITSTVDQIGSRLLFRGYGLSTSARPIHAGLLGTDTLFLLDEVHLAQPFAHTLTMLAKEYQQHWAETALPARWEVTQLSATPDTEEHDVFRLGDDDRDPEKAPVLVQRLNATKPAALKEVQVRAKDVARADAAFAVASANEVQRMLARPYHHAAAVILNRVDRARATYRELRSLFGGDVEVRLLTGRMRSYERDEQVSRLVDRLRTGRERTKDGEKIVVVATQCIEAGADFDFDALVSECASVDALLQRFGRLDRGGWLSANGAPAEAVILARSADVTAGGDPDPVYGDALWKTWAALGRLPTVDFGSSVFSDELRRDRTLRPKAEPWPVLLPTHLDAWVQTQPKPVPDPDPAPWLHGLDQESRDVTVVWRGDLNPEMLASPTEPGQPIDRRHHDAWLTGIRSIVTAIPPSAAESISLPIAAVRRWLMGESVGWVADVDGPGEEESVEETADRRKSRFDKPRQVVRWNGDSSEVIGPDRLTPGTTILVPSEYGGIGDHHSWDPEATSPVADVAEISQLQLRGRPVLRLLPGILPHGVEMPDPDPEIDDRDRVAGWLDRQRTSPKGPLWASDQLSARGLQATIRFLIDTSLAKRTVEPIELSGAQLGFIVTGRRLTPLQLSHLTLGSYDQGGTDTADVSSEPDTSSFTAVAAGLTAHLAGVGAWAERLARNCGLSPELVSDLALAGELHDLGKADPRFQAMLRSGGVPSDLEGQLLAKSAMPSNDLKARRSAQTRAGYPLGTRHELMSLALIEDVAYFQQRADDWELVRHLVASHHGWCRPFAPPTSDAHPVEVTVDHENVHLRGKSNHNLAQLDRGIPDRFWLLVRRYGWFRLAWLEAILRLADHQRSEAEQRKATA